MQWIEAAKARGIPYERDIQNLKTGHAVTQWCAAWLHRALGLTTGRAKWVDAKTGKRSDVAHHYLYSQADNKNLHIIPESKVKRVVFEGDKAVGVEFVPNKAFKPDAPQETQTIRARKFVVVSGGAMDTPEAVC